jgi:hypothetical protein
MLIQNSLKREYINIIFYFLLRSRNTDKKIKKQGRQNVFVNVSYLRKITYIICPVHRVLTKLPSKSKSSYIICQRNPKTVFVQGEHNTKYNDYNDSRQKITKYELEVERLRQENDRYEPIEKEKDIYKPIRLKNDIFVKKPIGTESDTYEPIGTEKDIYEPIGTENEIYAPIGTEMDMYEPIGTEKKGDPVLRF